MRISDWSSDVCSSDLLPDVDFGNPVFYANNLSASGDIDAGLSGNQLELFPGSGSPAEKTAALCTHLPSEKIPPGTSTMVRAGKIRAGMPLEYPFSASLLPTQRMAELDLRLHPGGANMVQFQEIGRRHV